MIALLTEFQAGMVMEIGMPVGFDLRRELVKGVARVTQREDWVLWVNGHSEVSVFAPAWFALGVNARRMVFAACSDSVLNLKPVFIQPLFKVIVLDGSFKLSPSDWAFLAGQSRRNDYTVVVVRPYGLSNRNGNVWAQVRANVRPDFRGANEGGEDRDPIVDVVKMKRGIHGY